MTVFAEELSLTECLAVLFGDCVGRVALTSPSGPRIVPVNYAIHNGDIVIRTDPHSELGTYGANRLVSFEVDQVDEDDGATTVVARGLCRIIEDPIEVRRLADPVPWAGGARDLYLRIVWDEVSGRRMGPVGAGERGR